MRGCDLIEREYRTVRTITGPLIFVEGVRRVAFGEMVEVELPDGDERPGQVIQVSERFAVIQVLGGTEGVETGLTKVRFLEEVARLGVSEEMLGRAFNGIGEPIDGLPPVIPRDYRTIMGLPINPVSRKRPMDFIQTGISVIDGLNTLVRGQKLPIFTGSGLPANELAFQIVRQAEVRSGEPFAVVFGAMGITSREAFFFLKGFEEAGAMDRIVIFLNLAEDPTIERLFTPRMALTAAEYLAFDLGMHVLVVLTDMTNYCEALREVSTAREEVPGRRGYPGYMYTDLATIYERAGRIEGKAGSVTELPIVTMPDDDITHPVPDLTGYITEGQIMLSRELFGKGIYPPVDVLPSLSRLMNSGIGKGRTREDHREVADQLYAFYARGRDARRLEAIVGTEGLGTKERRFLKFADDFEKTFINQGHEERSIEETLEIAWRLLSTIPREELTRVRKEFIDLYYGGKGDGRETDKDEPPQPEEEAEMDP